MSSLNTYDKKCSPNDAVIVASHISVYRLYWNSIYNENCDKTKVTQPVSDTKLTSLS